MAGFSIPRIMTGMLAKYGLVGAGLLAAVAAVVIVVDLIVVSDEERIEQFIEEVTGPVDGGFVDRAMRYVDPERVPLDVRVFGHAGVYDAQRVGELEQMFRKRMLPYYGDVLRVLTKRIEVDDGGATIRATLVSQSGRERVALEMRKVDQQRWLVSAFRVPG